jgi:hypothetical protein
LTVEADLERLFAGRQPSKTVIDKAPLLNWWHVRRFGTGEMFVVGVLGVFRPAAGSTLQVTGALMWMAHDLMWCRCDDGWYRLGYAEDDKPERIE